MSAWPQWVILALMFMGLGMSIGLHGKPRDDKYNAWATLIATALEAWLLYAGGFWGAL